MGLQVKYNCNCGYEATVFLGGGLRSINKDYIRRQFPQEALAGFEAALKEGNPQYSFENKLAYCPVCEQLTEMPVLTYGPSVSEAIVKKGCQKCGGEAQPREEPCPCPRCGKELAAQQVGLWD